MAIFLVNQSKTYKYERDGNYLWSPKLDKNGHHNRGYDLMKEVRKGDFILHNSGTKISAISVVREDCKSANKPEEIKKTKIDYDWSDDGWIVKSEYHEFNTPVLTKDLQEWAKQNYTTNSAFQRDGRILQRYLCNLSAAHAEYIILMAIKNQNDKAVIRVLNEALSYLNLTVKKEEELTEEIEGDTKKTVIRRGKRTEKKAQSSGSNLYRITSLEGFLSILINKKERFVNPIDSWEDTYEGYMLQLLATEEGTEKVLRKLFYELTPENDVKMTIRNYTKLLRARYVCYGQCWSKKEDSDALWRIYSYNKKAIQIISNRKYIKDTFEDTQENNFSIRIADVKYDIDDKTSNLSQILYYKSQFTEPFYHKRPAFTHEDEVRVIVSQNKYEGYTSFSEQRILSLYSKYEDTSDPIKNIIEAIKSLDGRNFYRKNFKDSMYIDIKDLSKYIVGVKVHPQTEKWYEDLIRELCKQYSIEFFGKSTLYQSVTL